MKKINEKGLKEIEQFLAENHKKGPFSREMLLAWVADAEFQLAEGNSASIEIRAWDSVHGRAQEFTISDAGIDTLCPACGSGEFSAQFTIYTGIETTYQSCDECAHHWGHE